MKKLFLQHAFIVVLCAITLLTFLSRFIYLDLFPSLLLQDEAGLGYSAVSIAETGRDEWGTSWPVLFKSFGEYKAGVYIYVTAVIYSFVGWHPALARYASALASTFLAPALAWLVYLITRSQKASLMASVLVLTSPWAFHLGRQAVESNLALFFYVVGLCFFILWKERKPSFVQFFPTALFFALSMYTYQAYKLFVPLFLGGYLLITEWKTPLKEQLKKNVIGVVVTTALLTLPLLFIEGGNNRLRQVFSVQPEVVQGLVTLHRDTCHLVLSRTGLLAVTPVCHVIWNSSTISVSIVWKDILEHLSPSFLFFSGDSSINRNPTLTGAFFFFLLPFFYMGILDILQREKKHRYILGGLVTALIPSILAGTPHALRLTPLFPFVVIILVIGMRSIQYRATFLVATLAAVILFAYHTTEYAVATYANSQDFLSYSREVSQQAYRYWKNGSIVYLDHRVMPEPHIFIAYWNNMPPTIFQSLVSNVFSDTQSFTRPRRLSETLILDQIDMQKTICAQKNMTTPEVLITNEKLPFEGTTEIFAETRVHKFATVYELNKLKEQTEIFSSYCDTYPSSIR